MIFLLLFFFGCVRAETMILEFTLGEEATGSVRYSIHNTRDTFLKKNRPFRKAVVSVKTRTFEVPVENIPKGKYSITAYHDEDGDGELDTGFLGIPTEPVGMSNNPKGFFGPPSYDDAEFEFKANHQKIKIRLD